MDLEDRLKQLQLLFGHALSVSVTAKTNYLALAADLSSTPRLARAKLSWQQLEAQKAAIIAQMVALEELDQDNAFAPDDDQSAFKRGSGSTWRGYLKNWTERARPFAPIESPWTATETGGCLFNLYRNAMRLGGTSIEMPPQQRRIRNLVRPNTESLERGLPERSADGDVGGVPATCDSSDADPSRIVARIERMPAAAQIDFYAAGEVHGASTASTPMSPR